MSVFRCCHPYESTLHLLKYCTFAKCAWLSSPLGIPFSDAIHLHHLLGLWMLSMISHLGPLILFSWSAGLSADLGRSKSPLVTGIHLPPPSHLSSYLASSAPQKVARTAIWQLEIECRRCLECGQENRWLRRDFCDDRGCFVAAKCGHFLNAFSPLQAEALAFRELQVWASVRGFSKYHI